MRRHTTILAALVGLVLLVALAGCGGTDTDTGTGTDGGAAGGTVPADSPLTVVETGSTFQPATLEVSVGDTVTFFNEDSVPHQVEIDGATLETQGGGDSVTWTATAAGTYPYSCTIHPSMTGEIIVK